jgi:hypothetical protein
MENAPVGSQRLCRFAATSRKLTNAEEETFLETGTLPAETGIDPATVLFDFRTPDGELKTKTGTGQIVRDSAGAFHTVIPVEEAGPYHWRGYGKDSEAKAVFSTKKQSFRGMAF